MAPPLILVTGSSDGIGLETARQLATQGALVIVHGRNAERLTAAHAALAAISAHPPPAPLEGDLSTLAGARAMAAELDRRGLRPTVLVNNAGVFMRRFETTTDGIERTMAVNHFGHAALTEALLAQPACALQRVVNVSSGVHSGGRIDLDDLRNERGRFDGYGAYAMSKLANVLFTVGLAARRSDLAVNALHPGVVTTKLLREGFSMQGHDSLEAGAKTSVMLALDPAYATVSGEYFSHQRKATMHAQARDRAFVDRFWAASEAIVHGA